jgi:hypothetical protein
MTPDKATPDKASNKDERFIFQASAETHAIIKLLSNAEIGAKITYEQIIRATGEDPAKGIIAVRGFLYTAQRHLQREKNFVFGTIQGVGVQRLADPEIVDATKAKIVHVRRGARRAAGKLACADFTNLTKDQKGDALTLQSQLGACQLALSLRAAHAIEQKLEQGQKLKIGNVIDFFKAEA